MATGPCTTEPLVFRVHEGTPEVVREVLLERGWEEYDPLEQDEGDWNLYWRSSGFRTSDFKNLLPWQRLNHHPKTTCIARKDCLARNLRRMRGTYGAVLYGFSPMAFILPNDYTRFLEEYTKTRLAAGGKRGYWICKPVDLSRGRGIFVFDDIKHLTYDSPVIVQKYISNPLLISGYKFDLRIYVCVKSFCPLTIYMYQEGLVRFATEKFNLASLDNLFSHLTNTSINKFGPFYTTDKERVGQGCKWTMSKFRSFLHSQGINELLLWQKINNIVTLTLLTIAPSIASTPNCLELFGFDILIDSNFKPWLLEVNYSPALSMDCPADTMVKKSLINDFIDLMNYTAIDCLRRRGYLRQKQRHSYTSDCRSLLPKAPVIRMIPKPVYENKWQSHLRLNSYCAEKFEHTSFEGRTDDSACALHPAHLNSKEVDRNKKTSPLHKTMSCLSHQSRPENTESEWDHRQLASRSSHISWQSSSNECKLPAIHTHRDEFPGQSTPDKTVPSVRVGDFILTFPFNDITRKASQGTLDVKTIVHEVRKLTNHLRFSPNHKQIRKECIGGPATIKKKFGSLLWGPRYPPLLSEYCSSN